MELEVIRTANHLTVRELLAFMKPQFELSALRVIFCEYEYCSAHSARPFLWTSIGQVIFETGLLAQLEGGSFGRNGCMCAKCEKSERKSCVHQSMRQTHDPVWST